MQVLSLWQPWASLLFARIDGQIIKEYETRDWFTHVRGPILIHATKTMQPDALDFLKIPVVQDDLRNAGLEAHRLPLGCIIGQVTLVRALSVEKWKREKGEEIRANQAMATRWNQEWRYGNYADGRYCFQFADPILFDEPIEVAGHQKFWHYNFN